MKKEPQRGTKSLFCGRGFNFSKLRGTFSPLNLNFLLVHDCSLSNKVPQKLLLMIPTPSEGMDFAAVVSE